MRGPPRHLEGLLEGICLGSFEGSLRVTIRITTKVPYLGFLSEVSGCRALKVRV